MEEADVIRWAREAGGCDIAMNGWTSWVGTGTTEFLTRFAALVRAQALEDAAKVCEAIRDEYQRRESLLFSENKTDAQEGADDCAAAIRGMR